MKILVRAKTGAKEDRVIVPEERLMPDTEPIYRVEVRERPVEGRANESIAKLLSEHFGVSRSRVRLVRGATSRNKVFDIE